MARATRYWATTLALEQVEEEIAVLHQDRLIEAVLAVDGRNRLLGAAHAEQNAGGVARDQMHQHEGDDADPEQHRDELNRPIEDETEAMHRSEPLALARSWRSFLRPDLLAQLEF